MIINKPHPNIVQIIVEHPSEDAAAKKKLKSFKCYKTKYVPALLCACPEYLGQLNKEAA
tara:strand:+ start:293 stop:469 length:177 start_codon:yes stop_codon:yes gene_type:complete